MDLSVTVLNKMGNDVFNVVAETYSLYVQYNGSNVAGIAAEAVAFNDASNGIVVLTSSVTYLGIPSGTNINGVEVIRDSDLEPLITETFTNINYTANGTLTVNSITITVSVV